MLYITNNEITGSGAWNGGENKYLLMKPWFAENGAARWVIDNELGQEFVDSDGKVYKIRQRTAAELTAAVAGNAPANEIKRLQAALDSIDTHGILTLDNKGAGEIVHNLNSKWYAASITALDAAMPDLHVVCQKNSVTIKGGANNGKVTYLLTLIAPPKGRENQILTDPY